MKRYVFIGAVENSAHALRVLLDMGINIVDVMCPYPEAAGSNSDYYDLGQVAKQFGKTVYYFHKIRDEVERIRTQRPDIVFVLGLSQIVSEDILKIPTIGCIGIHPTLLPENRGRHPLVWALVNGLTKSGVTLFWLDEGADTGDIWMQELFEITEEDDARSTYNKVTELTISMLKKGVPELEQGIVRRVPQNHTKANIWRKRGIKDGEIDWRMSSARIYNLVRALTKPYAGAHCMYQGNMCKIWKIRIEECLEDITNLEPGKIVAVNGNCITVKTGDGFVALIGHELDPIPIVGKYL